MVNLLIFEFSQILDLQIELIFVGAVLLSALTWILGYSIDPGPVYLGVHPVACNLYTYWRADTEHVDTL